MWTFIIPVAIIIFSLCIKSEKYIKRTFYTDGSYSDEEGRDEDAGCLFTIGVFWLIIKLIFVFEDGFAIGMDRIWTYLRQFAIGCWEFANAFCEYVIGLI